MTREEQKQRSDESVERFCALYKDTYEITIEELWVDRVKHIDVTLVHKVTGEIITADLKGPKGISSKDAEPQNKVAAIELRNINGNPGSAYGEADYIIFDMLDRFIWIKRKPLVELTECLRTHKELGSLRKTVWDPNTTSTYEVTKDPEDIVYKDYKREEHPKELIVYIYVADFYKLDASCIIEKAY